MNNTPIQHRYNTDTTPLKVLIVCEESQTVCCAFRELGHEAFSNDLIECSGGRPEWHLKMDCFEAIKSDYWDLLIGHPPCTYMSKAGARWMYLTAGNVNKERYGRAMEARKLFILLMDAPVKHICIENPTPLKIVDLPKQTQIIQPYEYGHEYSKRTLLWLKNLPKLKPTDIKNEYKPYLPSNTGGKKKGQQYHYTTISQTESSKTFPGIAAAMASQWSEYIIGLKSQQSDGKKN